LLNIARRCVPFTPYEKDLATAVVTLVSAAGAYASDQEPLRGMSLPTEGNFAVRLGEGSRMTSRLGDHRRVGLWF